ncbi:MAG TPA: hypothetical protein VM598_12410 [Bdellovibrionota bacterium]|nr:hypothetical protein [Bdellovibrionota bacterium]
MSFSGWAGPLSLAERVEQLERSVRQYAPEMGPADRARLQRRLESFERELRSGFEAPAKGSVAGSIIRANAAQVPFALSASSRLEAYQLCVGQLRERDDYHTLRLDTVGLVPGYERANREEICARIASTLEGLPARLDGPAHFVWYSAGGKAGILEGETVAQLADRCRGLDLVPPFTARFHSVDFSKFWTFTALERPAGSGSEMASLGAFCSRILQPIRWREKAADHVPHLISVSADDLVARAGRLVTLAASLEIPAERLALAITSVGDLEVSLAEKKGGISPELHLVHSWSESGSFEFYVADASELYARCLESKLSAAYQAGVRVNHDVETSANVDFWNNSPEAREGSCARIAQAAVKGGLPPAKGDLAFVTVGNREATIVLRARSADHLRAACLSSPGPVGPSRFGPGFRLAVNFVDEGRELTLGGAFDRAALCESVAQEVFK